MVSLYDMKVPIVCGWMELLIKLSVLCLPRWAWIGLLGCCSSGPLVLCPGALWLELSSDVLLVNNVFV